MKISKEMAVRLHRMMWSDMLKELGNNPSGGMRIKFKEDWIKRNFPEALVMHNCFLCEYSFHQEGICCSNCPIKWPDEHCNGYNFSYEKAPISDILALPEKGEKCADFSDDCKKYVAHDETEVVRAYYTYRETLLSKASGIPASLPIEDHVKAIREKAVEEYFEKTPGAKLATMDVDQAFKQYSKEQMEPIFHALAEASGLSADESVKAHISKIEEKANRNSALSEIYRKSMLLLRDTLNKYKDELSDESGLDRNRPVADHIMQIYDDAFSDGQGDERARIMKKIGEMLNDKSARTEKD